MVSAIKIHTQVEAVPPGLLKPNQYNPNKMTGLPLKSLIHGIKTEGFLVPLLVQAKTRRIIDGEHRWRAARKLGMEKVPVIYLDVTDAEAKKLTTAMLHRHGTVQGDILRELVQDIFDTAAPSLAALELDLAISQNELSAMIDDAAKGMADELKAVEAKGATKGKSDKKDGKLNVHPEEPDAGEDTAEDVSTAEPPEAYRYPITFYAPDEKTLEQFREIFFNKESGDYSFDLLAQMVARYHKKRSK